MSAELFLLPKRQQQRDGHDHKQLSWQSRQVLPLVKFTYENARVLQTHGYARLHVMCLLIALSCFENHSGTIDYHPLLFGLARRVRRATAANRPSLPDYESSIASSAVSASAPCSFSESNLAGASKSMGSLI